MIGEGAGGAHQDTYYDKWSEAGKEGYDEMAVEYDQRLAASSQAEEDRARELWERTKEAQRQQVGEQAALARRDVAGAGASGDPAMIRASAYGQNDITALASGEMAMQDAIADQAFREMMLGVYGRRGEYGMEGQANAADMYDAWSAQEAYNRRKAQEEAAADAESTAQGVGMMMGIMGAGLGSAFSGEACKENIRLAQAQEEDALLAQLAARRSDQYADDPIGRYAVQLSPYDVNVDDVALEDRAATLRAMQAIADEPAGQKGARGWEDTLRGGYETDPFAGPQTIAAGYSPPVDGTGPIELTVDPNYIPPDELATGTGTRELEPVRMGTPMEPGQYEAELERENPARVEAILEPIAQDDPILQREIGNPYQEPNPGYYTPPKTFGRVGLGGGDADIRRQLAASRGGVTTDPGLARARRLDMMTPDPEPVRVPAKNLASVSSYAASQAEDTMAARERAKQDELMARMGPYKWEYNQAIQQRTGMPSGEQYGPIIEDFEGTELGADMVRETPYGKAIDTGAATRTLLGLTGRLAERDEEIQRQLDELERSKWR